MLGLLPFRLRIRIEVKLTTKKTVKATLNPISNEKSFSTISWAAKRRKDNNEFFFKHVMYIYNFPHSLPFRIVWYVNRNFRGKKEGRSSILIFILFVYWKTIKKWTRKMLVDTNCYGPFQKAMHHITLFFSVYNNRNCTYITYIPTKQCCRKMLKQKNLSSRLDGDNISKFKNCASGFSRFIFHRK